jgi:hypothetical protein
MAVSDRPSLVLVAAAIGWSLSKLHTHMWRRWRAPRGERSPAQSARARGSAAPPRPRPSSGCPRPQPWQAAACIKPNPPAAPPGRRQAAGEGPAAGDARPGDDGPARLGRPHHRDRGRQGPAQRPGEAAGLRRSGQRERVARIGGARPSPTTKSSPGGPTQAAAAPAALLQVVTKGPQRIDPGMPISAESREVTGISDDDVKGQPAWADVAHEVGGRGGGRGPSNVASGPGPFWQLNCGASLDARLAAAVDGA